MSADFVPTVHLELKEWEEMKRKDDVIAELQEDIRQMREGLLPVVVKPIGGGEWFHTTTTYYLPQDMYDRLIREGRVHTTKGLWSLSEMSREEVLYAFKRYFKVFGIVVNRAE